MENSFILSCESTVDMPFSYVSGRGMPVLFYSYQVDGIEYDDDMQRDPQAMDRFYGFIDAGKLPSTSQINEYRYEEFFRDLASKGDILHINFGSGMTPSVRNARLAAQTVMEEFPGRTIKVIDSYCSSSGYGLLVDYAADMRDEGKSMDEIAEWVEANCMNVHHQFFTVDLKYFKRSGRMSGATAALATVLNICPIMRLDRTGHIKAYSKARGKKLAIKETIKEMEKHAAGGRDYSGKCFISHSNVYDDAVALRHAVEEAFPNLSGKVRIFDIGTIIASHSGPGTVAVYFMGDERPEMD